jgi:4,5-dihydroxyphthalate decarboxylase
MVQRNVYDAGELAIVTYLQAKAFNKPYVILPTPISGRPQHHCIGFNIEHGDLKPKDIEGKKVGVRTYAQTTALWVRGILQHEYGVDLDKVNWLTIGDGHLAEYQDPSNCTRLPKGSKIDQMMLDGEVAAAILGIDMPKDPRVRTLVPNPKEAGKEWMKREGVVPINHLFAIHKDISEKRPDVVREIFRMIVESRKLAPPEIVAGAAAAGTRGESQGPGNGHRLVLRAEDHSSPHEGRRTVRRDDGKSRCLTSKRSGGQILVDALRAQGVDRVYCVPGESYLPVLDALVDVPEIAVVSARHEGRRRQHGRGGRQAHGQSGHLHGDPRTGRHACFHRRAHGISRIRRR